MSTESPFWALFGKVSAVIAVIGTLVGIYIALNQASEDIELNIESRHYNLNPNLVSAISKNFNAFSYFELRETIEAEIPEEISGEFDIDSLNTLIEKMHKDSWGDIEASNFNQYKGYSVVVVSNKGTKTAKDVKIDLPISGLVSGGLAYIVDTDDARSTITFKKVIPLGEIRAGTKTTILIWSARPLYEDDFEKINITYENGVGETTWRAKGLNPIIWMLILWTLLCLLTGLILGFKTSSTSTRELDSENNEEDLKSYIENSKQ